MAFIVTQLGARMHYAVPRILQREGLLEHFFTDFCALPRWTNVLRLVPSSCLRKGLGRVLGRAPPGIPANKITAFNSFGIMYAYRRRACRSPSETTAVFLWAGREFCKRVSASSWGEARAVFTFNSAGLEVLEQAKSRGMKAIMEQTIAPQRIQHRLLERANADHADWQPRSTNEAIQEYAEREQAEWEAAHQIICGSDFVREGIRSLGGPADKCVVVPYGVNGPGDKARSRKQKSEIGEQGTEGAGRKGQIGKQRRESPLRVLTVGAVGLRKGAPYVLEAARQLCGRAEFRWVGSLELLPEPADRMRACVALTGSVARSQVQGHFAWADAFLLPSLCEGSATVTYEALAAGLPVICTPNTGSVVRDGIDGFIVPPEDSNAIVEKLVLLASNPELRLQMAEKALERAAEFTLERYGERLLAALR